MDDDGWRRRLYNAYPDVGGAKVVSVIGLIAVIIVAISVAVGYVVLFPRQPSQWYILYNVIALMLMLSWMLALMHGAYKPSLRALSISIVAQLVVIGCCLAVAFMLFLGLYYEDTTPPDLGPPPPLPNDVADLMRIGSTPATGLEEVIDMPAVYDDRAGNRWPLRYSRSALTIALFVYAVIQLAILAMTMRARAAVYRALVPTNTIELS